ncbi:hypothetical protein SASPL_136705 [Salvia splendens]|uniref:Uncharacterized protein n=1 Tax=Salvia splendens TaxID=180675 RepID=A0A8X8ZGP6_SALSN|nr:putative UPF0496 protein 5 [Salvia splendens]KAG6404457.1 hypothetical protein SASPL_136705 [Salvia splendens]
MKPSIPPPTMIKYLRRYQSAQPIPVMAEEIVSAFDDLQKDDSNNEKLVDIVRSHYENSLISLSFCSTLQRRVNTIPPPLFHKSFRDNLSRIVTDHSTIETTLKPMHDGFVKDLDSIDFSQKVSAFFFVAAVIICTVASAIATANANPGWAWAAVAGVATAAPTASIVFGALGKWRHSVLNKSETTIKKQREITTRMIQAADCGIKDLKSIEMVAKRLESETKSLSRKKVAAVKRRSDELLQKVKNYNDEIKWVKQRVLDIIIKP